MADLSDAEWLREQYAGKGRSASYIARRLGRSPDTVLDRLREYGIELRGGTPEELKDEEWLRREYVEEGRSLRDIADGVGSSDFWVRHWLKEHGIPTRTPWRSDLDERLDDPGWLREKYHGEGMTLAEIAEEAGCSGMTVSNRLREHDIETRGRGRR